ncbi:MAG: signal recognition particle subunit SRP19/SEC65 family protein [Candidatus Methanoplasma sp.]|jgi:signal recognition particle subunit SRP19|nr:signal recognition particle subunit SRP19/SEC65 family protein [Candidatus Methanoplasma sp.]
MAYDKDTAIVVWPEYFDAGRTRSEGRRLPKKLCVAEPSLDIIAKGAMSLDLEYEVLEGKAYPADWAAKRGCVRIERGKMPKTAILPLIGEVLVKNQKR